MEHDGHIIRAETITEGLLKEFVSDVGIGWKDGRVVFSADSTYFAWSSGFKTILAAAWNAASPAETKLLSFACPSEVTCLAFGCIPDASLEQKTQRKTRAFSRLSKTENGQLLVAGMAYGRIGIWSLYSGELLLELLGHQQAVLSVAVSPDATTIVSVGRDGVLNWWALLDDGNRYLTARACYRLADYAMCCATSPTDEIFVTAGTDKMVTLWSFTSSIPLGRLKGHLNSVSDCVFSSDGCLLATSSLDTSVILWDPYATDDQQAILRHFWHMLPKPGAIFANGANNHHVLSVSFSRDDDRISTVCEDGFVRVWDLSDPSPVPFNVRPARHAVHCGWSSDGQSIAVATADGRALMFAAPLEVLSLQYLCRQTLRKCLLRSSLCKQAPDNLCAYLSTHNDLRRTESLAQEIMMVIQLD